MGSFVAKRKFSGLRSWLQAVRGSAGGRLIALLILGNWGNLHEARYGDLT